MNQLGTLFCGINENKNNNKFEYIHIYIYIYNMLNDSSIFPFCREIPNTPLATEREEKISGDEVAFLLKNI